MADEKFVKPAKAGAVIPHPDLKRRLPAEGDWWPDDQFLKRRLRDGDVVEAKPPSTSAAPAAKSKE